MVATLGLLLSCAIGAGLKQLGVAAVTWRELGLALLVTLALQAGVWWIAHRGWDVHLSWDPHYVHLPMLLAAAQLNLYIYLVPEARYLVLVAWFVSTLFTVGLAGFREVVALSAVMTAGYLAVLDRAVHRGERLNLDFEHVFAAVFFLVSLYAGAVLERLRRERAEMSRLRATLAQLAATDDLTGLPNRRQFETILEAELASIRRYGGRCSVAMIDVDQFKNYNDSLGHVAGDALLRQLAQVLRERLRSSDMLARYGGEEFGLVMRHTPGDEAIHTVDRLRVAVENHAFPGIEIQPGGRLSISAGVAGAPEHGTQYHELVQRADEALYRAKAGGRNRVEAAPA